MEQPYAATEAWTMGKMKCPLCREASISWFRVILHHGWAMFRGFGCGHCGGRFRRNPIWTVVYSILALPVAGLSMAYGYLAYMSSSTVALIAAVTLLAAVFISSFFIPWAPKR
jgi:hypothetical protein